MNGGALVPLDNRTSSSFARPIHKLKLLLRVLRSMLTKIQPSCPNLETLWQKSLCASLGLPVFCPSFPQILFSISLIWATAYLALAFVKEGIIQ